MRIHAARAGGLTGVLLRDVKHLEFLQSSIQNECWSQVSITAPFLYLPASVVVKIRPLIYFANVLTGMTPHPAAGGGCGKQGFF